MNWLYLALLTAILWGLCYSSTEQIVKYIDMKSYLILSCLFSCIGFSIWGYLDGTTSKDLNPNVTIPWVWIFISSITSFFACYCSVAAVKCGGASLASVIEISYPIWVVIFVSIINGKSSLNLNMLIGGILIFLGTAVVIRGTTNVN